MDIRRLIVFFILSFAILFGWNEYQKRTHPERFAVQEQQQVTAKAQPVDAQPKADVPGGLQRGSRIKVTTDLMSAEIDTVGGDIRKLALLKHGQHDDASKPFVLFNEASGDTYVAQTGLFGGNVANLPFHRTLFTAQTGDFKLVDGQKNVVVRLEAPEVAGVKVAKILTFTRDSYVVDVKYEITNRGATPLTTSAYFQLLRDSHVPEGSGGGMGSSSFTGPGVYGDEHKLEKIEFKKLDKGTAEYPKTAKDGWIAMMQHYFTSAWMLSPNGGKNVCAPQACNFEVKSTGSGLYTATAVTHLPAIASGTTYSFSVPLYAGPQETRRLQAAAEGLDLVKDYGMFAVLCRPLFALLDLIHQYVGNWGWAIVIMTFIIKIALYPLAASSARSMAKMKLLAPRMERLKEKYGDDRMKFQQAVMDLYKQEKVNPLGGCLPILLQMPVFLALFWTLSSVVEMRQAPWAFWIHDLAKPDPFYVLPILMAITSYVQTLFNPPATDPMQDKMMKIMPVAMSVLFLFFPSGLVLYYVVSNVLQIAQQWWITRQIEQETAAAKAKA
ncbi:membrane protein insertase YidC [Burkholderiaceae bacterium DAT-1]|nr:membrane protein insertase YidC [Burkholderiaceae bacterium DAT-1]